MAFPLRRCVRVGGGTKGVHRIVEKIPWVLEWGFWPKWPGEERNGNLRE